jgi:hypothetical protein
VRTTETTRAGDDVAGDQQQGPDEESRLRTMFITYEAGDDAAEVFMVVMGSIIENFKGVSLVEYQDDTVFADGGEAMGALYEMAARRPLTEEQRSALDSFTEQLEGWTDGESGP